MTQQATEIVEREFEISEREWARLADACNVPLPDVSVVGNPWSVAGTGVPILVLIRESSVNKKRDLLRLLMRTLIALGDEEGVEQLRAEGIGPLLHRESYPGTIYRRLPDRGRASIRACGNVWVVLIFGSAAMENVDGNGLPVTKSAKATHNAVTMLVRSVFERLRPRICRVGGFDRLVRAYKGSSELLDTFTTNVGFLEFGHQSLWMADPNVGQEWQAYTMRSTAAHNALVDKQTDGKLNAVRLGLWPFAAAATPLGLVTDRAQRLVVSKGDSLAVELVLAGLASGLSDTEIARSLVAHGLPARRFESGKTRMAGDVETVVSGDGELRRVLARVRRLIPMLPDLAMGKLVVLTQKPRSFAQTYLGFRPVFRDGFPCYQLIWDVPDLFAGADGARLVEDDVLDRAIAAAVVRRVEWRLPGSDWLEELSQREHYRQALLACTDDKDPVVHAIVRWARRDGSMIDVLAPGEHPRFDHFKTLITEAAATAAPRHPHPNQAANGYMTGLPVWLTADDREDWVAPECGNYALFSRPVDKTIDPVASLLRAKTAKDWPAGPRVLLGLVDRAALHRSVADAIARAIDAGVDILAQCLDSDFWFDDAFYGAEVFDEDGVLLDGGRRDTDPAGVGSPVSAAAERVDAGSAYAVEAQALRRLLAQAEQEAAVLMAGLLVLAGTPDQTMPDPNVPAWPLPTPGGIPAGPSVVAAEALKVATQQVNDAYTKVEELKVSVEAFDDLAASPGPPTVAPTAQIDDLHLLTDMLVTLRTEKFGSARAVRLWHKLIPRFRATMDDGYFRWELDLVVRLPGGHQHKVGPITGKVVTNARRDLEGDSDPDAPRSPTGESGAPSAPDPNSWAFVVTRHVCTVSLDTTPLHDGIGLRNRPGAKVRNSPSARLHLQATDFLTPFLGRRAAAAATSCPVLEIRTLIWNLAFRDHPQHRVPETLRDVTEEYRAILTDVYDNNPTLRLRNYHDIKKNRQPVLDFVIAAGGELDVKALATAFITGDGFDDKPNRYGRTPRERALVTSLNEHHTSFTPVLEPVQREDSANPAYAQITGYRARTCPHCADEGVEHYVDMVLRVPEVPTGLMCSRCLKVPLTGSPTYPAIYRDLPKILATPLPPMRPERESTPRTPPKPSRKAGTSAPRTRLTTSNQT